MEYHIWGGCMFCFDAFGRVVAQSAPGRDPRRVILSSVELGAGRSARCEHQCSKIQDHCGNAKIAAMRRRCRLHHPFSMWCIAFAATSQWKTVNSHLFGFVKRTFEGWHQTRINEKANKVLRDTANRGNASKADVCFTLIFVCWLFVVVLSYHNVKHCGDKPGRIISVSNSQIRTLIVATLWCCVFIEA